jgi:hypothetical protein
MSERMPSDSELETLDRLKKKANFQNTLTRGIKFSIAGMYAQKYNPNEIDKELRAFFLERSLYWKKKGLTETEFNRAIELLKQQKDKRL